MISKNDARIMSLLSVPLEQIKKVIEFEGEVRVLNQKGSWEVRDAQISAYKAGERMAVCAVIGEDSFCRPLRVGMYGIFIPGRPVQDVEALPKAWKDLVRISNDVSYINDLALSPWSARLIQGHMDVEEPSADEAETSDVF